jgi:cytochrome c
VSEARIISGEGLPVSIVRALPLVLLLAEMCASCHAIEKSGASPHPAAPPFRRLSRRLDIDELYDRLREGLLAGHRDMPAFRFSREDARAIRAYVRSIEE